MTHPSETAEARARRIASIRRQIAAGEYDTPERMAAALEAFLDSPDARNRSRDAAKLDAERDGWNE